MNLDSKIKIKNIVFLSSHDTRIFSILNKNLRPKQLLLLKNFLQCFQKKIGIKFGPLHY